MSNNPKSDHDMLVEMHSIVCGNGNKGLCQKHDELAAAFYKFRLQVIAIACISLGSGGMIGFGVGNLIAG
jgi:hypothetical protein